MKTIEVDQTHLSFAKGIAEHTLDTMAAVARSPQCTAVAKKQWKSIKKWLEATNDELTEQQREKWILGFISYMASKEDFSDAAEKEKWPTIYLSELDKDFFEQFLYGSNMQKSLRNITKRRTFRIVVTAMAAWTCFVIYKTYIAYEHFDEDHFWGYLIIPPILCAIFYRMYLWIKKGF